MSLIIDVAPFVHAELGMTRFPPNVEQITVERKSSSVWLIVRRNEVVLRFPLSREDRYHLVALLSDEVRASVIQG